jgi:hypothetical protein
MTRIAREEKREEKQERNDECGTMNDEPESFYL